MKDQIATLLKKEMDRKDFLKYLATAGVMAVGGGMIMQSVGGFDKLKPKTAKSVGYGSSSYGGKASKA